MTFGVVGELASCYGVNLAVAVLGVCVFSPLGRGGKSGPSASLHFGSGWRSLKAGPAASVGRQLLRAGPAASLRFGRDDDLSRKIKSSTLPGNCLGNCFDLDLARARGAGVPAEVFHGIGGGAAEVVALGFVGAEGAHEFELLAGFDALDDDLHVEVVGHGQNRLDKGSGLLADGEFGDEGAIEFERVEEELGQIAEAGVAGAEVVHGDADTAAGEAADEIGGALDTGEGGGLGEFELQEAGAEAGAAERVLDFFEEGVAGKLDAGDVDGNLNGGARSALPEDGVGAGALHDIGAEGNDKAALFGDGDEVHGRDGAEGGVGPAREGFEADDGVGGEIEFGLVVDADLAVLDGAAQFALEHHAFARGAAEAVAKLDDAVFAVALGGEHGAVGVAQELAAFGAVIGEDADADAGGDADGVVLDGKGVFEDVEGTVGGAVGVGHGLHVVKDEGELIAADAGEGVGLAEAGFEALGNLAEEGIADAVAEAVIDQLEAVEVDIEERDFAVLAAALGEAVREAIGEQAAIGQAGEVVDERSVLQASFGVASGAIAALQFGEHGVEAKNEVGDFFTRGEICVEGALSRNLEHGAGEIADGLRGLTGFVESRFLLAHAEAEVVDAREDYENRRGQGCQHEGQECRGGRHPGGLVVDHGQVSGRPGLDLRRGGGRGLECGSRLRRRGDDRCARCGVGPGSRLGGSGRWRRGVGGWSFGGFGGWGVSGLSLCGSGIRGDGICRGWRLDWGRGRGFLDEERAVPGQDGPVAERGGEDGRAQHRSQDRGGPYRRDADAAHASIIHGEIRLGYTTLA